RKSETGAISLPRIGAASDPWKSVENQVAHVFRYAGPVVRHLDYDRLTLGVDLGRKLDPRIRRGVVDGVVKQVDDQPMQFVASRAHVRDRHIRNLKGPAAQHRGHFGRSFTGNLAQVAAT